MKTIKLNDPIYDELHILTKAEFKSLDKCRSLKDKKSWCAFLPGYGTALFCENMHFLVINENEPLKKYAIWRNHSVIGYCDITQNAAEKANGASDALFYFGFDKTISPEKYK